MIWAPIRDTSVFRSFRAVSAPPDPGGKSVRRSVRRIVHRVPGGLGLVVEKPGRSSDDARVRGEQP